MTDLAAGAVVTPKRCRLEACGADVPPPNRRGQQKDFCCDKHRAAWHLEERRKNVQRLEDGLVRLQQDLDELRVASLSVAAEAERQRAVINGALSLIETSLKVGRKPPRGERKKVVDTAAADS